MVTPKGRETKDEILTIMLSFCLEASSRSPHIGGEANQSKTVSLSGRDRHQRLGNEKQLDFMGVESEEKEIHGQKAPETYMKSSIESLPEE